MEALKNFRINNKVMLLVDRRTVSSGETWCRIRFMDKPCGTWIKFGMLSQRNLQNVKRVRSPRQWKKSGLLFGFLFIHCLPARGQDKIH
ncbi:hypothetical protein IGI04_014966 [Brassica rapa subsp. trilocularis]|uniref:TF-B3 domain-containing protein n=1 Tax=Brassica rapa subsp. trilocularis TaxID=1813537 RepID=A0ABQ7MNQ1_BRACM|nr:hypothetical protein IGI04_014966 [Brassica rapa subsp. trilocularis]